MTEPSSKGPQDPRREQSLQTLILEHPLLQAIIEHDGRSPNFDYGQTLDQACHERKLNSQTALNQLDSWEHFAPIAQLKTLSLAELITYIQTRHHARQNLELPFLHRQALRLSENQGNKLPELITLEHDLKRLLRDIFHHTDKEDRGIFPWILALERGDFCLGSILAPLDVLKAEHHDALQLVVLIEQLTTQAQHFLDDFTFQILYLGLKQFHQDLEQHIEIENSLLFPHALKLAGV